MCYGFYPVIKPSGSVDWLPRDQFFWLHRDGRIVTKVDGFHYRNSDIGTFIWRDKDIEAVPMRWDLVPRHFLQRENPTLAEMIKRKNSRAKGSPGFSSYNARVETVTSLFSFRDSWREGLRFITPASAFRERPGMEGAPKEFTGKEYNLYLDGEYFLAGIWDAWENKHGERLDSCTVITVDSAGNEKLRGIWHERCPVILDPNQAQEWLDPKTTPARALELCKLLSAAKMEVKEVPKPEPKSALPRSKRGSKPQNPPDDLGNPVLLL